MPLELSGASKYGAPCSVKKKISVNKKISTALPGLLGCLILGYRVGLEVWVWVWVLLLGFGWGADLGSLMVCVYVCMHVCVCVCVCV
jgi:hypothetical protein